jgi:hypothetical protein
MSARRHFSRMSALFEGRALKERVLHVRECAVLKFLKRTLRLICIPFVNRMALVHAIAKASIELIANYFHSFEIFFIQIGEMAICSKPEFIIIKSNYFQNAQKGECFLEDFEH